MQNNYFILRHGQTPYQVRKKKMLYPWPEPSPILLTKKGEGQVKAAIEKLKKEKIDLIYASDMPRTRQTAEMVAQELEVEVIFDNRLWERDMGIYWGKSKEEYRAAFPVREQKFSKPPLGGESWNDVKKRVTDFLKEIDKKHQGKNILIVSHGCPLWLLQGGLKELNEDELLEQKKELNLEVGELRKL